MFNAKLFAAILPVFLILDALWLGVVMKDFYRIELGDLARKSGESLAPRWPAAILVYLLIPGGLVLFVRPLLGMNPSALQAIGWGAAYGLVVYGVYDLTNYAVLANWSLRMTIADILWGCTICSATAFAMRLAAKWLA